jgi:hypothetical protein
MGNREMRDLGTHGGLQRAIALDASLSREAQKIRDSDRKHEESNEADPIRGLRNGLAISIAFWIALYFVIQLMRL